MNMFSEIKGVVSVRDAASFYGLNVNNNGMCVCPFHADKNPSMKVDKRFHCFGCKADGEVINFVQRMFNLNAKEAAIKIIEDFHLGIDIGRKETETQKNKRIRTGKKKEYEKKIREAYLVELKKFHNRLSEIHRLLVEWEKKYSPSKEQWEMNFIDRRYSTALYYKNRIEYILDVLDYGEDEEIYEEYKHREETIDYYERKITEVK